MSMTFIGIIVCCVSVSYVIICISDQDFRFQSDKFGVSILMGLALSFVVGLCLAIYFAVEKKEQLIDNPEITNVGQYKGCDVSHVDTGNHQFYIAKCGDTVTKTETISHGKSSETITTIIKNN